MSRLDVDLSRYFDTIRHSVLLDKIAKRDLGHPARGRGGVNGMKEIVFEVAQEGDGGFTAEAIGESIFTQADNWDELRANVREAVQAFYFDSATPASIRLRLVRDEVLAVASPQDCIGGLLLLGIVRLFGSPVLSAIDPRERPRMCGGNRTGNRWNVMLNNAPAIRREGHDGDFAASHVLLILKREVARKEEIVPCSLRCIQQVAILKAAKSGVHGR